MTFNIFIAYATEIGHVTLLECLNVENLGDTMVMREYISISISYSTNMYTNGRMLGNKLCTQSFVTYTNRT